MVGLDSSDSVQWWVWQMPWPVQSLFGVQKQDATRWKQVMLVETRQRAAAEADVQDHYRLCPTPEHLGGRWEGGRIQDAFGMF